MPRVPDLPGDLVPRRSDQEVWLKRFVAGLCGLNNENTFPGSQPVSFRQADLDVLEKQDFWVCEKSDGVRALLFVCTNLNTNAQDVYLIDRKNEYRRLSGLYFPHYERPEMPLRSTMVDGELVIEVDPTTGRESLRFLAFDCLIIDDQNVMARTLDKRYGRLTDWFYKPYAKMMRDHPHMANGQPFDIRVKEINFSYSVDKVFADIPSLHHVNDGLIYTCVNAPYSPGTDHNILKWKPPSENSVDFKLVLRFPPSKDRPDEPDFHAKPVFILQAWNGGDGNNTRYETYDLMHVEDDEWEQLKATGEQVDDRIVEVYWDPVHSHWRMMRFRSDKPNGNHKSVVESVIQSIAESVEKETLLARSNSIRTAWKARHGQPIQASSNPTSSTTTAAPHLSSASTAHHHHHPLASVMTAAASATPPRAPPPPAAGAPKANGSPSGPPPAVFKYLGIAKSRFSKVSGPTEFLGLRR